jgi:hypothetical protein
VNPALVGRVLLDRRIEDGRHPVRPESPRYPEARTGSPGSVTRSTLDRAGRRKRRALPTLGVTASADRSAVQEDKPCQFSARGYSPAEKWANQPRSVTSTTKSVTYVLNLKCYPCPDHTIALGICYLLSR